LDKPFLKGGNGCPLGEQSDTDPQKERAAKFSHQQDYCFHRRVHRIFPFLSSGGQASPKSLPTRIYVVKATSILLELTGTG
jgi:hypothetical protein